MSVTPIDLIVHRHGMARLAGMTSIGALDLDGSAVWRNPITNRAERLPADTFGILTRLDPAPEVP
jgi:hypothetical protein